METLTHLIKVQLGTTRDGLTEATTEDLPGLYLIHPEREQILRDLPEAIRILFKESYHQDVRVFQLSSPSDPPAMAEVKRDFAAVPLDMIRVDQGSGA